MSKGFPFRGLPCNELNPGESSTVLDNGSASMGDASAEPGADVCHALVTCFQKLLRTQLGMEREACCCSQGSGQLIAQVHL